mmetsp:Transcript_20799/g.29194  ORF Transcript_20799/g.29194 Transcript_20799/m.29194 type:complete len:85 (+) Transcript_20799:1-255(+)
MTSTHGPRSRLLDVKSSYPRWDPQRHYLVTILPFLKNIFYMKNFGDDNVENPEALKLSKNKKEEYEKKINSCVKQNQVCACTYD